MAYIVDLSGKVPLYDEALYNALKALPFDCRLLLPSEGLACLIPKKYKSSTSKIKRLLKLFEGLVNYLIVISVVIVKHPDILHFQWLPFLEFCGVERYVLKIMKILSPNTSFVLTVHNLYPHNISNTQKKSYEKRFMTVSKYLDSFIVHTEVSRKE